MFGGGTDYAAWYQENGGSVLSASINHYIYLSLRKLPQFFDFKNRIVWKMIEETKGQNDIQHPVVRVALEYMKFDHGIELHYHGDLPSRTGLGSSSAFTVGFLNALHALNGDMSSKLNLATDAIHIERDILKENVGIQDQIASAYGGFNKIDISPNGEFTVRPVIMRHDRLIDLQSHMLMFYTGVSRSASEIAGGHIKATQSKKFEMNLMQQMTSEAIAILGNGCDLLDFGRLLNETWKLKRSISSGITTDFIDSIYEKATAAGAVGGKLLGAGGGGFVLFFASPEKHQAIKDRLSDLLHVPFKFEYDGSCIIHCEPVR